MVEWHCGYFSYDSRCGHSNWLYSIKTHLRVASGQQESTHNQPTMAQEPSLLTDISTRAAQEYSDLFAVSGTSFLSPAIDQTATTIQPNSPPPAHSSSSKPHFNLSPNKPTSLSNHLPDTSSLIDLVSMTPLPPKPTHPPPSQDHDEIFNLQNHSPTRSSKKYSFLLDHSISSFDLLPKVLSPSTPVSPPCPISCTTHLCVLMDFWHLFIVGELSSHRENTSPNPQSHLTLIGLRPPHPQKLITLSPPISTSIHRLRLHRVKLKVPSPAVPISLELILLIYSLLTIITHHVHPSPAQNLPPLFYTSKLTKLMSLHICRTTLNHPELPNLSSSDLTVPPKVHERASSVHASCLDYLGMRRVMITNLAG